MKVSHTGKYTKNNRKNLYVFASKDPESVVNTKLRCLCEGLDFGGGHFQLGIIGLLDKRLTKSLLNNIRMKMGE